MTMPTRSGPSAAVSSKNFSLTSAFVGAVYTALRPCAAMENAPASATSDLPEPVGVASTTLSSASRLSTASSWCGYNSKPEAAVHSRKASSRSSAVRGFAGDLA